RRRYSRTGRVDRYGRGAAERFAAAGSSHARIHARGGFVLLPGGALLSPLCPWEKARRARAGAGDSADRRAGGQQLVCPQRPEQFGKSAGAARLPAARGGSGKLALPVWAHAGRSYTGDLVPGGDRDLRVSA